MNKVISILAVSAVTLLAGTPTLSETQVVILGTGTPVPDHTRAGAGVAIVYESQAYIFDVGGGVVQRAIEASSFAIVSIPRSRSRSLTRRQNLY